MTNQQPLPKKVQLSETDFKVRARNELILRWKPYEAYGQALEGKYTDLNSSVGTDLREPEIKMKATTARVCLQGKHPCNDTSNWGASYARVHSSNPVPPKVQCCSADITRGRPSGQHVFLKMNGELEQNNWTKPKVN